MNGGKRIFDVFSNESFNTFIKGATMKRTILFSMTVFVLLCAPVQGNSADVAYPDLPRIAIHEFKRLIDKKSDFILIDSRDSSKYNREHITGAVNIHFDSSGDPMIRKISLMALPMDKMIIVYSDAEGEKTAVGLVQDLFDMGWDRDKVKLLSDGMEQWKRLGYPLVSFGK